MVHICDHPIVFKIIIYLNNTSYEINLHTSALFCLDNKTNKTTYNFSIEKNMEVKQEVLVIGEILYAKKFYEELKGKYIIKVFDSTKKEFLVEATAKYENVAAILLANGADRFIDKFDNEVLDSLSPAINVIIVIGDASKLVDVKAATDNGVFVADTSLSSIKGSTKDELEKLELEVLNNLDFALITGVPKDPVNKIDEVSVIAADKAINYLNERGEIDLDVSDIQISLS
ncbi:hypothetical protein C2G38_1011165 [Gigaspora rosea]|uniref:D-isomer specific 2-hydroxyacid dehydrogenase catalytic domain-containing protein n=1 Tax=Gigaspora rosea TaxID=44941 RepID=A0A397VQU0_9GLOM|nr:hypothetical protein C2G38_1011165 [Gigaspora rosea]